MRLALILVPLLIACGGKEDTDTDIPVQTTSTTTTTTGGEITMEPVGTASWSVRGITLFSAPLSDEAPGCVVDGKHTKSIGVWGPGEAHPAPYDNEISAGAAACGYRVGESFTSEEFSGGNGVWLGVVLVPNMGNVAGSSPDFDSGDVINWDRFPLLFDGDLRRGPFTIADADLDGVFPGPEDFGHVVNGHSHAVLFLGSAVERMPAGATPPGEYGFHLALRDATSDVADSGWNVVVPFVVADAE